MENTLNDPKIGGLIATGLGLAAITSLLVSENFSNTENFDNDRTIKRPPPSQMRKENFYNTSPGANGAQSNTRYSGPNPNTPRGETNVNLNESGDQLLSYQIYQQAVNAATPTQQQLDSISGQSYEQTGAGAVKTGGGVSDKTAPYSILNGNLHNSEYQAVNFANQRAENISACAQNAPTFVATSLLPKPTMPGEQSWDINAPQNILANQNFLSATQQVGIDTVLGSLRNPSYDLRNNIPNPINVVSPWMNTTITPDLERRPLDTFIPSNGIYGAAPSGCNTNPTYVGK